MLAVAAPVSLRNTALSVPTPTQSAAPTPCPVSSNQKTLTATPITWPALSLPLGLLMSSIHMGATPASAIDMTSPMTLSILEPGASTPITCYATTWETGCYA